MPPACYPLDQPKKAEHNGKLLLLGAPTSPLLSPPPLLTPIPPLLPSPLLSPPPLLTSPPSEWAAEAPEALLGGDQVAQDNVAVGDPTTFDGILATMRQNLEALLANVDQLQKCA
ncbi:uncharacterized protein LOC134929354 isoform X3 [Pseudophryne corroboree]|uniref:uncharacterized protein LOC134929354 isoform X3 n=1 Tax=Pseudophryne corroboree TaxID=495146 RepID=UPI00308124F7